MKNINKPFSLETLANGIAKYTSNEEITVRTMDEDCNIIEHKFTPSNILYILGVIDYIEDNNG